MFRRLLYYRHDATASRVDQDEFHEASIGRAPVLPIRFPDTRLQFVLGGVVFIGASMLTRYGSAEISIAMPLTGLFIMLMACLFDWLMNATLPMTLRLVGATIIFGGSFANLYLGWPELPSSVVLPAAGCFLAPMGFEFFRWILRRAKPTA